MTQEEKELLLIDLSARLPYNTLISIADNRFQCYGVHLNSHLIAEIEKWDAWNNIKPYLRPMSSMTEKERNEYDRFVFTRHHEWDGHSKHTEYVELEDINEYFEFLNSHHFDYRGLIKMGLALEAPEGMYKIEEEKK